MTATNSPPESFHQDTHEQNDNWAWSDELTTTISNRLIGHSLKVCTGLRPICDVNLDLKSLHDIADSPEAPFTVTALTQRDHVPETYTQKLSPSAPDDSIYALIQSDTAPDLYDGYACHGDMFDLPFDSNTFDTVVSDPPWLSISQQNRETLFTEILRVTKPGGQIIYNATWIPDEELAHRTDLRFRQQLDFWGGPSFIAFYNTQPETVYDLPELSTTLLSQPHKPPIDCPTTGVDPRLTNPEHSAYRCPNCDCTTLYPVQHTGNSLHFDAPVLYECPDCAFRPVLTEVYETAISDLPHAEPWMFPSTYTLSEQTLTNNQTTIDDWHPSTS